MPTPIDTAAFRATTEAAALEIEGLRVRVTDLEAQLAAGDPNASALRDERDAALARIATLEATATTLAGQEAAEDVTQNAALAAAQARIAELEAPKPPSRPLGQYLLASYRFNEAGQIVTDTWGDLDLTFGGTPPAWTRQGLKVQDSYLAADLALSKAVFDTLTNITAVVVFRPGPAPAAGTTRTEMIVSRDAGGSVDGHFQFCLRNNVPTIIDRRMASGPVVQSTAGPLVEGQAYLVVFSVQANGDGTNDLGIWVNHVRTGQGTSTSSPRAQNARLALGARANPVWADRAYGVEFIAADIYGNLPRGDIQGISDIIHNNVVVTPKRLNFGGPSTVPPQPPTGGNLAAPVVAGEQTAVSSGSTAPVSSISA